MKWKYLFLFLLFFSALLPVFSDSKPPEEMTTLEILNELEANLTLRENLLDQKETELNAREGALNLRESEIQKKEESWTVINNLFLSLSEEQRKRQAAEFWRGFIFGVGAGFAIGETTGIYLGFKLKL